MEQQYTSYFDSLRSTYFNGDSGSDGSMDLVTDRAVRSIPRRHTRRYSSSMPESSDSMHSCTSVASAPPSRRSRNTPKDRWASCMDDNDTWLYPQISLRTQRTADKAPRRRRSSMDDMTIELSPCNMRRLATISASQLFQQKTTTANPLAPRRSSDQPGSPADVKIQLPCMPHSPSPVLLGLPSLDIDDDSLHSHSSKSFGCVLDNVSCNRPAFIHRQRFGALERPDAGLFQSTKERTLQLINEAIDASEIYTS